MNPGDRAVRFINNLTLCDEHDGQPFRLRPWQEDRIIRPLFGTLRPDGRRQYKRVFLFIPRKQAKTQLSAAIGLYGLLGQGKRGEQVICAASDREQASHLFDKCVTMIEADRFLEKKVRIYSSKKRIETRKGNNVLKVVSADGRRQHGNNPSILLFDELHTQPDRRLFDALTSAQGARKERLVILITTAGNRRDSLCHEEYVLARKVASGKVDNPSYLPIIFEADQEDDWTDEATWHKAMPALGDFCDLDYIREEFALARESPGEEAKFKNLFLNLWVASVQKWLRRVAWDRCGEVEYARPDLAGLPCYGSLDLSSTEDITAFVLTFPMDDGSFKFVCRFWVPEAAAERRALKGDNRYHAWAKAGYITLTPGDVIDHDLILGEILGDPEAGVPGLRHEFDIRQVRIDEWNCAYIAAKLIDAGLEVEKMRQGFVSMNEPTKWLDVLIARELIHHGNHPVLNWMADNAVTERDSHGNVKLSKGHSADKIDGMVCLVMGLAAALSDRPESRPVITFA